MNDWRSTVQPHLTDRGSVSYMIFRPEYSTAVQGDYAEKIAINHVFYKPGYYAEIMENIMLLKKLWEQNNSSVAVYESSSSGEPQIAIVTRYKTGLKERDRVLTALPERFKAAHGEAAWNKYLNMLKEGVTHSWSEILYMKKELNSQ